MTPEEDSEGNLVNISANSLCASRERRNRSWWRVAAGVVVVVMAALWVVGWVPGPLMRAGPLDGISGVSIRAPLQPGDTGMLWGQLLLQNSTDRNIELQSINLLDFPEAAPIESAPYLWGEERIDTLSAAAVTYPLPLPSHWKIPVKRPVRHFVIPPQRDGQSVEVVYELPAPSSAATYTGISVQYRSRGINYLNKFDISITVCPVSDLQPCR